MQYTPNNKQTSIHPIIPYSSTVYNKEYLKNQEGNFRGYPYRTYVGSTFMGGYSDHFPVYVLLVKEIE